MSMVTRSSEAPKPVCASPTQNIGRSTKGMRADVFSSLKNLHCQFVVIAPEPADEAGMQAPRPDPYLGMEERVLAKLFLLFFTQQ